MCVRNSHDLVGTFQAPHAEGYGCVIITVLLTGPGPDNWMVCALPPQASSRPWASPVAFQHFCLQIYVRISELPCRTAGLVQRPGWGVFQKSARLGWWHWYQDNKSLPVGASQTLISQIEKSNLQRAFTEAQAGFSMLHSAIRATESSISYLPSSSSPRKETLLPEQWQHCNLTIPLSLSNAFIYRLTYWKDRQGGTWQRERSHPLTHSPDACNRLWPGLKTTAGNSAQGSHMDGGDPTTLAGSWSQEPERGLNPDPCGDVPLKH